MLPGRYPPSGLWIIRRQFEEQESRSRFELAIYLGQHTQYYDGQSYRSEHNAMRKGMNLVARQWFRTMPVHELTQDHQAEGRPFNEDNIRMLIFEIGESENGRYP